MKKFFIILLLIFAFSIPVSADTVSFVPEISGLDRYINSYINFPFYTSDGFFAFQDYPSDRSYYQVHSYSIPEGVITVFTNSNLTKTFIVLASSSPVSYGSNSSKSIDFNIPLTRSLSYSNTFDGKTVYYSYIESNTFYSSDYVFNYGGWKSSASPSSAYKQDVYSRIAWLSVYATDAPVSLEYAYQAGLGSVTDVRYTNTIDHDSQVNTLGVTVGQFTSTGLDLSLAENFVEARIMRLTDRSNNIWEYWGYSLLEDLDALFKFNFDTFFKDGYDVPVDIVLTPCRRDGNIVYFGDSYIIDGVRADRVGVTIFDNYMSVKDPVTDQTISDTSLGQNTNYVTNWNITEVSEVGDTVTNLTQNYYSTSQDYNYTTNYYNSDNSQTIINNYYSGPSIEFGPARPNGEGVDFYDNFNWSKFMTSLLSFFTAVTVLLPLLTGLLSFLPLWAIGLLESCIMACLLFSLARGIFTIIKGVVR